MLQLKETMGTKLKNHTRHSLRRVLNVVEDLQVCTLEEIANRISMKKVYIRYVLDMLVEYSCVEKEKMAGVGNKCKYTFMTCLPAEQKDKDWSEHYAVFNNMVKHGQIQRSI